MCGIVGVISECLPPQEREAIVWRMVAALRHRGPDAQAVRTLGPATFGVARLSIVDRPLGNQPMIFEDQGEAHSMIAYNGEVYNFLDLRQQLTDAGTTFRTRSDTEVVLAAHARWGDAAIHRLDGMFAYAVWDRLERRLVLVRDRFGIKPLFYADLGHALLFASEPKALFASGLLSPSPNPLAVVEFFTHGAAFASGYVTQDRSFFNGVLALPPGHVMRWTPKAQDVRRYWAPIDDLGSLGCRRSEAPTVLQQLVTTSVRSMLMGEVPIGTALSGGLDSSAITAVAAQSLEGPLVSACITYRDDHDDPDARHAALLSSWLNAKRPGCHRLAYTYLPREAYLQDLDRLILAFDEPHWEPRQLAMFANYRKLADLSRTVILTGEGSDELFFGYYQKFPGFRSPPFSGPGDFARHWRQRLPWVRRLLAPTFANGLPSRSPEDLLDAAVDFYFTPYWQATGDRLRAVQCWYLHTFLPWLLMVNDRCSMAHSLEGRFPFLAKDVVAFALKLPPAWNVASDGCMREKLVLREAFSSWLPPDIWRNRAKSPLPLPQAVVYHETIADALAAEMRGAPSGVWDFLDKRVVRAMVHDFRARAGTLHREHAADETLAGYLPLGASLEVRTQHLFAILTLIRWYTLNFGISRELAYGHEAQRAARHRS
jgi:asparagine synthase (glutamine-hydrolysing)